jgi:hypothetical protein
LLQLCVGRDLEVTREREPDFGGVFMPLLLLEKLFYVDLLRRDMQHIMLHQLDQLITNPQPQHLLQLKTSKYDLYPSFQLHPSAPIRTPFLLILPHRETHKVLDNALGYLVILFIHHPVFAQKLAFFLAFSFFFTTFLVFCPLLLDLLFGLLFFDVDDHRAKVLLPGLQQHLVPQPFVVKVPLVERLDHQH